MEFLRSVTAEEARSIIADLPLAPPQAAAEPLDAALGRVLADDVVAGEDIPPFSRSLVDGYAVKAKDTYGARETTPSFLIVRGEVRVGQAAGVAVSDGEAVYVATGAMIPDGADGVVMEEYTRVAEDAVEVTRTVRKGENVVYQGEDIHSGVTVLHAGKRLAAADLGVLAALGLARVPVFRKPVVGLISSGDEVLPVEAPSSPGKVRDINRYTVIGLIAPVAEVRFVGIAPDTIEETIAKLEAALDCDCIIVSGGSSKGERDFMTTAIERLGGTILFHGINIRPGKPTILANLQGKPVFGLPGHPVSCAMVCVRFVLPLLRRLSGERGYRQNVLRGTMATNVPSSYGVEEYARVTVEPTDEGYLVSPLFAKSSVISTLSRADGYVVVPEGREGLENGEIVEVHPLG